MKYGWCALALLVLVFLPGASAQMIPSYSMYDAESNSPAVTGPNVTTTLYVQVTVDGSTGGSLCNQYGCIQGTPYHNGQNYAQIQNTSTGAIVSSGWGTGPSVIWNSYLSYSFTKSTPVQNGVQYKIDEIGEVLCTVAGLFFQSVFSDYWEIAFTNAYWNGTPLPQCFGVSQLVCNYLVHNNCTAATSPPDLNMENAIVGDTQRPGATYLAWTNVAKCTRPVAPGPWTCSHGAAWNTAINAIMPPYPCTHHP